MYQLCLATAFFIGLHPTYAQSAESTTHFVLSEVLSQADYEEDEDVAALRAILKSSNLYRVLLTMNNTVPNMTRVGEYVLLYSEIHHMNQTLDLILAELKNSSKCALPH